MIKTEAIINGDFRHTDCIARSCSVASLDTCSTQQMLYRQKKLLQGIVGTTWSVYVCWEKKDRGISCWVGACPYILGVLLYWCNILAWALDTWWARETFSCPLDSFLCTQASFPCCPKFKDCCFCPKTCLLVFVILSFRQILIGSVPTNCSTIEQRKKSVCNQSLTYSFT